MAFTSWCTSKPSRWRARSESPEEINHNFAVSTCTSICLFPLIKHMLLHNWLWYARTLALSPSSLGLALEIWARTLSSECWKPLSDQIQEQSIQDRREKSSSSATCNLYCCPKEQPLGWVGWTGRLALCMGEYCSLSDDIVYT